MQIPTGLSYEDSNASFSSNYPGVERTHSNFSAVSRATSTLISRTHSTFLQGHKKFSLKRKSLWERVGCALAHVTAILCLCQPFLPNKQKQASNPAPLYAKVPKDTHPLQHSLSCAQHKLSYLIVLLEAQNAICYVSCKLCSCITPAAGRL